MRKGWEQVLLTAFAPTALIVLLVASKLIPDGSDRRGLVLGLICGLLFAVFVAIMARVSRQEPR